MICFSRFPSPIGEFLVPRELTQEHVTSNFESTFFGKGKSTDFGKVKSTP